MKFHLIGGDFFHQLDGLCVVAVFSFGQTRERLKIARLAHWCAVETGIG